MKGTIDQVEAHFEGITSVWTRVILFFLTCWAAYFVGSAAACLQWTDGSALVWSEPSDGFAVLQIPADWTLSLFWASAEIGGVMTALFLFTVGYLIAFTTIQRLPMLLVVMLVQSWVTWSEKVPSGSVGLMVAGYTWQPLPGIIVMVVFTLAVTEFGFKIWRRDHPSHG